VSALVSVRLMMRIGYAVAAVGVVYALAGDLERGAAIFIVGWMLVAGSLLGKLFCREAVENIGTGPFGGRWFLVGMRVFVAGIMVSALSIPLERWGGWADWADAAFAIGLIICGIGMVFAVYGAIRSYLK